LRQLGAQLNVPVYADDTKIAPHGEVAKGSAVAVCRAAVAQAKQTGRDVVILDTAGRLHIDDALMGELREVNTTAQAAPGVPGARRDERAGRGQQRQGVQRAARGRRLILTKFDSDTRGGALLSAKLITGKPVKFIGTGEKLDAWRSSARRAWPSASSAWATSSLVTEAQQKFSADEARRCRRRWRRASSRSTTS
jgi:signal recognition particle subunit SRP54